MHPTRIRRVRAAVIASIAIATLLSAALGPGTLHASEPPEIAWEPVDFEAHDGSRVPAEEGRMRVLENRDDPDGRRIELAFVRFASTNPDPGPPIVYLAGGPGGSGIETARGTRFPLFQAFRAYSDVIAFDQRGTGSSEPDLSCPGRVTLPMTLVTEEVVDDVVREYGRKCAAYHRELGVDLSAYNTLESAADLNDLRRSLGAEKLILWGISYGTHLALAAMKDQDEHIDRVILAGIEGPDQTYKLPSDQQALLETIAGYVARDPATKDLVPDLLGSIDALLTRLEGDPVSVELTNPMSGEPFAIVLGKDDLQYALAMMLRGPESFAGMADLVYRLEQGDWTALAIQAAGQRLFGFGMNGMSLAMDCASGLSEARARRIERERGGTLLSDAINAPYPAICEEARIPDAGEAFRAPTRSDVPALLLSGTLDGRTPPGNAVEVMRWLPNATHVVIEGAGHSDPLFLSSPKILEDMEAFLRDEPVPHERISIGDPELIAPRQLVVLSEEELDRFTGQYRVDANTVRVVMRAGPILLTRRGDGPVLPIRPVSATEFFYEGSRSTLEFVLDENGEVASMIVWQDGVGEGHEAPRIP